MTARPDPIACDAFEADVAELSVGTIDEPRRSALLAHASACASCRETLDEVTDLADRLLLLAPEVEPPAGFEMRALAPRRGRPAPRWRVLAGTVAALLAFVVGVVVGVSMDSPSPDGDRRRTVTATVVAPGMEPVGIVSLADNELTLSLDSRAWPDKVACELLTPDGEWMRVATWRPDDRYGGEWNREVDESLAGSTEMRLVDTEGTGAAIARAYLVPVT